jgi:hypothetical protein
MHSTRRRRFRCDSSDASTSENDEDVCGDKAAALVLESGGCSYAADTAANQASINARNRKQCSEKRMCRDAAEIDAPIKAARIRGYFKPPRSKRTPKPAPPASPNTEHAPHAQKRVRIKRVVSGPPIKRGAPLKKLRSRRPSLWRFFVAWKRIEYKGQHVHVHEKERLSVRSAKLLREFQTLSGPMQYYWVHMFELWRLYERQQIAVRSPLASADGARQRTRDMMLAFYYLDLAQQKLLVDDWVVERTARQQGKRAAELETCLARKTLAKIKIDILTVVSNIDYVLREGLAPHQWQGAFEGI